MLGMVNQWIYDKNPLDGVRFEAPLKELKDDLTVNSPRVFMCFIAILMGVLLVLRQESPSFRIYCADISWRTHIA